MLGSKHYPSNEVNIKIKNVKPSISMNYFHTYNRKRSLILGNYISVCTKMFNFLKRKRAVDLY